MHEKTSARLKGKNRSNVRDADWCSPLSCAGGERGADADERENKALQGMMLKQLST